MDSTDNRLKRPAITHRPWLSTALWDVLTRLSILHADAYVMTLGSEPTATALKYLVIDYRRGGRERIALDAWLVEADGLTPMWDALDVLGRGSPVTWGTLGVPWARLHRTVVETAYAARGPWSRVSLQCHYVRATDRDTEPKVNAYKERAKPLENPPAPTMGDLMANPASLGKRRGRPPRRTLLPDIL